MHPKITYVTLYMLSADPWVAILRGKEITRSYRLTGATAERLASASYMQRGSHHVDRFGWSWTRARRNASTSGFGDANVCVEDSNRPLDDCDFASWHDDPGWW